MLYVTVTFDPQKVERTIIDDVKQFLKLFVAEVLSAEMVRLDPTSTEDINTKPEDVVVEERTTQAAGVNVRPLEIHIEASDPKGRSGQKIVELLGKVIAKSRVIPARFCGEGQAGISVTFHEQNAFGFIPKHS